MTEKTKEIEDVEFIEEYNEQEEAMTSHYAPYFRMAEEMLNEL